MKTSQTLSCFLVAVVGLISLQAASPAFAAGGGGGVNVSAGNGATAGATGTAGGQAGGTGSNSGGRAGGQSVTSARATTPNANVTRGANSASSSGLRSGTGVSNVTPRYLPGGFTPNVSGGGSSSGRSASGARAHRPLTTTNPVTATQQTNAVPQVRANNAWTDPASRPGNRQAAANRNNRSADAYRNYIANGNYRGLTTPDGFAGSYLYPGAYGSALNSYHNSLAPRGALTGDRHAQNFARDERWYGRNSERHRYWPNGYAPYFGFYGYPFFGSFGYGDAAFGGFNGDVGVNTGTNPSFVDQSVATVDSEPRGAEPADARPPEAAPQANASTGTLGNGPDSLVEAVQAELARRGYFTGKVDAIYGADTKEAIRRFQTDQKLSASGRVNEATLHALQLD